MPSDLPYHVITPNAKGLTINGTPTERIASGNMVLPLLVITSPQIERLILAAGDMFDAACSISRRTDPCCSTASQCCRDPLRPPRTAAAATGACPTAACSPS